jgi:hypothetical protein
MAHANEAIERARAVKDPLKRAWMMIKIAGETTEESVFLDALTGAVEAADWCTRPEAGLLRERIAQIQSSRGPAVVPAQLGASRRANDPNPAPNPVRSVTRLAIMPHQGSPEPDPEVPGPVWVVRSALSMTLATIYQRVGGGFGARLASDVVGNENPVIGGGPRPELPLTAPRADGPLSWRQVAEEVAARLSARGWWLVWVVD